MKKERDKTARDRQIEELFPYMAMLGDIQRNRGKKTLRKRKK